MPKKVAINTAFVDHPTLTKIAQRFGLSCRERHWLGVRELHRFRCGDGHDSLYRPVYLLSKDATGCKACRQAKQLKALQERVKAAGVACLETQWLGSTARYRFVCAEGHAWTRTASNPANGCAACSYAKKGRDYLDPQGLTRLQQAAADKGGRCLSMAYTGVRRRYQFECAQGHTWETQAKNVLAGSWCMPCSLDEAAARQRLSDGLARLQASAQAHGGACLTERYEGTAGRYRFRCAQGHTWWTRGSAVLKGTWCAQCARTRRRGTWPLEPDQWLRLQAAAVSRGGLCSEAAPLGSKDKYGFRCGQGHTWQTTPKAILRGQWCPICRYDKVRLTLADAQATARERGGECLSQQYIDSNHKLTWQCHRGHTWDARYPSLRQGHWCPQCAYLDRVTTGNAAKRQRYEAVPLPKEAVKAVKALKADRADKATGTGKAAKTAKPTKARATAPVTRRAVRERNDKMGQPKAPIKPKPRRR